MPQRRQPLKLQATKVSYLADLDQAPRAVQHKSQEAIERIKKCLARARHQNANKQEAKAALLLAAKYQDQYNISEADVMIAEESSERAKRGGISTVDLFPATEDSRAYIPAWLHFMTQAITDTFECQSYTRRSSERNGNIVWCFYGIAEHTLSAAIAFETIHNQIQHWSKKLKGVSARNSYCLGIGDELLDLSEKVLKEKEKQARKNEEDDLAIKVEAEEAEEQARLSRLNQEPLDPISESDNEDDDNNTDDRDPDADDDMADPTNESDNEPLDDMTANEASNHGVEMDLNGQLSDANDQGVDVNADLDAELQRVKDTTASLEKTKDDLDSKAGSSSRKARDARRKQYSKAAANSTLASVEEDSNPTAPEPSDHETAEWKSMRQLQAYREKSRDIEADVLKENNIKLSKARRCKRSCRDANAYRRGRRDGKKIEICVAARIKGDSENAILGRQMDLIGGQMDLDLD